MRSSRARAKGAGLIGGIALLAVAVIAACSGEATPAEPSVEPAGPAPSESSAISEGTAEPRSEGPDGSPGGPVDEPPDEPPPDEPREGPVTITTVARFGSCEAPPPEAEVELPPVVALVADATANLYVARSFTHEVARIDGRTGEVTAFAGVTAEPGFSGDGGPAEKARLDSPQGVAVDEAGNVFIADTNNHRVRRVDAESGAITTVAGTGAPTSRGDGGPATSAGVAFPRGLAIDGEGDLYIAESGGHVVRRVDAGSGRIETIAGSGAEGFAGDGGPATAARLSGPEGVALDASGNLFIADTGNNRIRLVDPETAIIRTVAGTGESRLPQEGDRAPEASLIAPASIALDVAGNGYLADTFGHRLLRVDERTGEITAIAGTGERGQAGDGGPATAAQLMFPQGVTLDADGNLFTADLGTPCVRKVGGAGEAAVSSGIGPGAGGEAPAVLAEPGPEPGSFWVTNPTSGARLFVRVISPEGRAWGAAPALVLVPGGTGDMGEFLRPPSTTQTLAQSGFVVVLFDPDGRGRSEGAEDQGGFIHQDGLAAVIRFAADHPEIDSEQLGVVSVSFGVTMAAGALARHPDLPVRFLIDWEGPADRSDTGGCDADQTGHLQDIVACDDESFWAEREALTFIGGVGVPYQRLQSQRDHAQPDADHAFKLVNAAVDGDAPWTRLNDLPPNQRIDPADPPLLLNEESDRALSLLIVDAAFELLDLPLADG